MPDIAPAVLLTLSLDPLGDLRPHVGIGQGMRATITTVDRATGVPLAATGVRVLVARPGDPVPTEYAGENLAADGVGRWVLDIPSDVAGGWRVRAECAGPRLAARELAYWVTPSPIAPDEPPAPLLVTALGEAIATPSGHVLTAARIDRLPELGALLGSDKLAMVRDDAAGLVTGQTLMDAAAVSGATAGADAGADAGSASGAASAMPLVAQAQLAAATALAAAEITADTVANGAVQAATLAALTTAMAASATNDLGIVLFPDPDEGEYRKQADGSLLRVGDTRRQLSAAIRARDDADSRLLLLNGLRQIIAQFGIDGAFITRNLRVEDDGDNALRLFGPLRRLIMEANPGGIRLGRMLDMGGNALNLGPLAITGDRRDQLQIVDIDGTGLALLTAARRVVLSVTPDRITLGSLVIDGTGITGPGIGAADVSAITTRVARSLDTNGNLILGPVRADQLGYWQGKLVRLEGGDTGVPARLGLFGDSWVYRENASPKLTRLLQARWGNGGPGLVRLHAPDTTLVGYHAQEAGRVVTAALSGTGWVSTQSGSSAKTLSAGRSVTSTVGDAFQISGGDASTFSAARLIYTAGGAGRFRWNGGTWTSLDMSTGNVIALDANRPSSGAYTLDWENVSGTTDITGVTLDGATGVIVDKPASGGLRADHWAAISADPVFQAQFSARTYDAVAITLGTNDEQVYLPDVFAAHMETFIDNLRATNPLLGIAIIMPCANKRTNGLAPMNDYWAAAREVGHTKNVAVHSMQTSFGTDPVVYGAIWPDDFHTDPTIGGGVMASAMLRAITI
jgi:hypothetical protein